MFSCEGVTTDQSPVEEVLPNVYRQIRNPEGGLGRDHPVLWAPLNGPFKFGRNFAVRNTNLRGSHPEFYILPINSADLL
jgi:hypothetical protein